MFARCQTQWRLSVGMGGAYWQGLDYNAADIVMRRIVRVLPDDEPVVWQQLQILEDEAKKYLNKS